MTVSRKCTDEVLILFTAVAVLNYNKQQDIFRFGSGPLLGSMSRVRDRPRKQSRHSPHFRLWKQLYRQYCRQLLGRHSTGTSASSHRLCIENKADLRHLQFLVGEDSVYSEIGIHRLLCNRVSMFMKWR